MNTGVHTRHFPPVARSRLVNRSRLFDLSDPPRKLTLVAAPAGFGKTTALGQLFEAMRQTGVRCCWYSMSYEDNDPALFVRNCIAALRTELPDFGAEILQLLNTTVLEDIDRIAERMIEDLSDTNVDIALFIDDFHHARSHRINRFIDNLLEVHPQNFRLIVGSRIRPPLALSTLKLNDQLNDITVGQLRFDERETGEFLRGVSKLNLTDDHLTALFYHSEGWVAGLQLASLSLHDPATRDAFIDSFSGSLRDISDYLSTDVLDKQEPDVQSFLLRTSICERLSASLCEALTEMRNAGAMLEKVEANNLFLVPLDYEGNWYRYHHLFQEYLFAQLRRRFPNEIPDLYRKASAWFAQSGYDNEAIDYALMTGDIGLVGRLVHQGTLERLTMEGRMAELLSWVNRIPPNVKTRFPRLLIQECLALSHLCRPREADELATQARASIQELESSTECRYSQEEMGKIRTEEKLLPMLVAFAKDDTESLSGADIRDIETRDDLILAMVDNFLGYAQLQKGNLDEALDYLHKGRIHHLRNKIVYGATFSDCFIAMSHVLKFQLHKTYEHVRATEKLIAEVPGGHAPAMAKAKVMQAVVLYEWGRVEEAVDLLTEHLPFIDGAGHVSITQQGYLTLARCRAATDDFDRAEQSLRRCLRLSEDKSRLHIDHLVYAERTRISAVGGPRLKVRRRSLDGQQAQQALAELEKSWDRVTFAHLMALACESTYFEDYETVRETIESFAALCNARALKLYYYRLQLLAVIGDLGAGETARALKSLGKVIEAVCPEHGRRLIQDCGPRINLALEGLSRQIAESCGSFENRFLDDLLDERVRHSANPDRHQQLVDLERQPLIEPLQGRETQIVELLASGKSNAEIRELLFISENTVKWHIKNIFAKLGVNNRTAAVVAAQRLKIISIDNI